jgi:2-dehydro-3-deoxyglucarate aldolase/4-hydroxy-2-oxoheptanedioate aldolase
MEEIMEKQRTFVDKMHDGQVCLGTAVTFSDATVTEALTTVFDFVWIDMEHNPLSLEAVQAHIMAAKGSDCTPIVRVPWNDPVLIKPVLDIGAPGIVVPFVRTADETRLAVSACRYPPEGIRGYGPRRPSNYARLGGPEFCKAANEAMLTIIQVEHIDAINNLDAILAVPGVAAIMIGANDLSGSMGHMGEPRHPEVLKAMDVVLQKSSKVGIPVGVAVSHDPDVMMEWVNKGVKWLMTGNDFTLMLHTADQVTAQLKDRLPAAKRSTR